MARLRRNLPGSSSAGANRKNPTAGSPAGKEQLLRHWSLGSHALTKRAWTAEFDHLRRARAAPMVLEHGVDREPRPHRQRQQQKNSRPPLALHANQRRRSRHQQSHEIGQGCAHDGEGRPRRQIKSRARPVEQPADPQIDAGEQHQRAHRHDESGDEEDDVSRLVSHPDFPIRLFSLSSLSQPSLRGREAAEAIQLPPRHFWIASPPARNDNWTPSLTWSSLRGREAAEAIQLPPRHFRPCLRSA